MNAYLNQVIKQFRYGRLGVFAVPDPTKSEKMAQRVREWWREPVDVTPYLEPPEDDEIRYLHEGYDNKLHECAYCDRLYEAEQDAQSWCCDDCYALRDEGRD